MSQAQATAPETTLADRSPERVQQTGARLIEKLDGDHNICSACYARVRHPHDDVDAALEAKTEGTLLRVTATSGPDPATFSETVPPTSLPCDPDDDPHDREARWRPARARTICSCGQIDRPETTGPRSAEQRQQAAVNVADRCREDGIAFDADAAKAVLTAARERPSLGGKHRDVFETAVGFGLEKA